MAKYKKALMEAFKPEMKAAGFKKKSATWHRTTPEIIHVFNIQTSNWSETYYFNAAVYFRALGSEETPPEYHCHIRTRIPDSEMHRASVERAISLSDFECVLGGAEQRITELKTFVQPLLFDWFERFRDVEHAKQQLSRIRRPWFAVSVEVWPLLGLKRPK